jgi:ArsR family transcriptional regulator
MLALPFADQEFDTIILDDVLGEAEHPVKVLDEARRVLRPGGRILLLATLGEVDSATLTQRFSTYAAATALRLAPPRAIPDKSPSWLLAVATPAERTIAAA